jgi:HisJ family histidinol phosphate phosphatase
MSLPADYHMHTPLCRHARGEPDEYVRRALELGFKEIGFSDHAPMPQDDFDNWRMNADKLDEYVAKVRKVQKDFPQLTIRLALEVDYLPGYEDWIRGLAARHQWLQFTLNAKHFIADRIRNRNCHKKPELFSRIFSCHGASRSNNRGISWLVLFSSFVTHGDDLHRQESGRSFTASTVVVPV